MPNIKIKTAEAALIMGCSPQFVRIGLQQGILDIGNAIKIRGSTHRKSMLSTLELLLV